MRGWIAGALLLVTGCSGAAAPTLGVAPADDYAIVSDAGGAAVASDAGSDAPSCATGRTYCCSAAGVYAGKCGCFATAVCESSAGPTDAASAPACAAGKSTCTTPAGITGCYASDLCACYATTPGCWPSGQANPNDPGATAPPVVDVDASDPDVDPHAGEKVFCCTGSTGPATAYCLYYENGIGNAGYSDTVAANACKWEPATANSALSDTNP